MVIWKVRREVFKSGGNFGKGEALWIADIASSPKSFLPEEERFLISSSFPCSRGDEKGEHLILM